MHLNNISGASELKQRVEENLNIFIQLLIPRGLLPSKYPDICFEGKVS